MIVLILLCGIFGGLLSALATAMAGYGWLAMLAAYSGGGMLSVLAMLGGTFLWRPALVTQTPILPLKTASR